MTALRTPAQAVAFALSQARWEHAMCLNFVWRCYAPDDTISSALSSYGFPPPIGRAIDGWNGSPQKHTDRSPQLGAPVYYSAATSGATAGDGHIAIYVGGGMIRSTDAGGYGINATVPLDWPERNWGRRMLGWTGDILGHPLTQPTPQEDALSAAEVKQIIAAINASEARILSGVRRDSRARAYKHATTGEIILINWHANPGEDRIMYVNDGPVQLDTLYKTYQITADTLAEAKVIQASQWPNLLAIARGTDTIFTRRAK